MENSKNNLKELRNALAEKGYKKMACFAQEVLMGNMSR
jgi:hypothetical protein